MPDDRLVTYYEQIRQQVEADRGSKYPLTASRSVREYAEFLQGEISRRRLEHTPILWPLDQNK